MPIAPLSDDDIKQEFKREQIEREWYATEKQKDRDYNLDLARINAKTERERIRDQKRYIHAITLLRLFSRKVPKVFLKHLS